MRPCRPCNPNLSRCSRDLRPTDAYGKPTRWLSTRLHAFAVDETYIIQVLSPCQKRGGGRTARCFLGGSASFSSGALQTTLNKAFAFVYGSETLQSPFEDATTEMPNRRHLTLHKAT